MQEITKYCFKVDIKKFQKGLINIAAIYHNCDMCGYISFAFVKFEIVIRFKTTYYEQTLN